eukprot:TRINITY_DN13732_c0_g1_i1.p1 TRINITY_DN13732_c0_g1~~TRINITY_DN13732_c0_g1_i1.p1  ORF type:complete len:595 (+),score=130.30 TRINITY_DN13732_c0_g1_i1:67-1851(+)
MCIRDRNGKALIDVTAAGSTTLYAFDSRGAAGIVIDLLVFIGNPSIYLKTEVEKDVQTFEAKAEVKFDARETRHLHYVWERGSVANRQCTPKSTVNVVKEVCEAADVQQSVYILLDAHGSNATYSLTVRTRQSAVVLQDSLEQIHEVAPGEVDTFTFGSTFLPSERRNLTFYLKVLSPGTEVTDLDVKVKFLGVAGRGKVEAGRDVEPLRQMTNQGEKTIEQKFFAEHGLYAILVKNLAKENARYAISMSSAEFLTLSLNRSYINFMKEDGVQYFEVYVSETGTLVVDIAECLGKVRLGITHQLPGFTWEDEDTSLNSVRSRGISVIPGKYYFAVRGERGVPLGRNFEQSSEVIYKVQSQLLRQGEEFKRFIAGRGGLINFVDFRNRSFELDFAAVEVLNKTKGDEGEYIVDYYFITATHPQYLHAMSRCGDFFNEHKTFGHLVQSFAFERLIPCDTIFRRWPECRVMFTFEEKHELAGIFYGTVRARVFDKRSGEYYFVVYESFVLDISKMEVKMQRDLPYILILWLIIVVLSCSIYGMYKKHQRRVQTMTFELQETRNMAALSNPEPDSSTIVGVPETGRNRFGRFAEDEQT